MSDLKTGTLYACGGDLRVSVGDFVAGDDGEVYIVVSFDGDIQAGYGGKDNSIRATVKLGDWRDVEEDPRNRVVLDKTHCSASRLLGPIRGREVEK